MNNKKQKNRMKTKVVQKIEKFNNEENNRKTKINLHDNWYMSIMHNIK
jgi:hypothetical protein